MNNIFIEQKYWYQLQTIFKNYCPNAEIWAYGSRINGNAHSGSDLDLIVKNFGDHKCNITELKKIIANSNIPFLIDICEFNSLPEYFKQEIINNYVVIFTNSSRM